jgi:methionyl-tRNA formyltransferase
LVELGTQLLVEHLPRVADTVPTPQTGEATYADKLDVAEFRVDPSLPRATLDRIVRAADPHPGAWFVAAGERYKVFGPDLDAPAQSEPALPPGVVGATGIGTAEGTLRLREIQPPGKRRMPWADWRRGHPADLVIDA